MHDLLADPLIRVRTAHGERRMNLPELLASLSAGQVEGYLGLRAHQADPWHVFLVQLAASVQARRPTHALPTEVGYWRDGLLDLADGKKTAWHLVEEDVTKPAFLQHPWKSWQAEAADYGVKTSRSRSVFEPKAYTPDELDQLITSKNHDLKMARIGSELLEAWLFALLVSQTMSGYGGKKNYGIIRMNSGSGSRPIVAWVTSLHPSKRFAEEVAILQEIRDETIKKFQYRSRGAVLTWLTPWNRKKHQYILRDLEPWFIEAARPVRLRFVEGQLVALSAPSDQRQIGPTEPFNGDVGDPWIPLNKEDKKKGQSALTLSAPGFTPELLTKLLFEQGFELTELQKPRPGDGPAWFVASALVGGNCTTDGFYRVELPVPPKARRALVNKQKQDDLGQFAKELLGDAKEVQRALTTALTVFAEGGPETADFDRDAVKRWLDSFKVGFSRRWEAMYFPTLWRAVDEDRSTVASNWRQELVNVAEELLDKATESLPFPNNRTWRAITQAYSAFRGTLHKKQLPLPRRTAAQWTTSEEAIL